MKTIFITGATAGFGKAIAYTFAQHAWRLILNGRRQDRLEALATELRNDYGADVLTLPFDVRDREAVVQAIGNLPHEWKWVDLLVNNAGLASGLSTIQEGDFADWDVMLDTNVKGLLNVFRCIAPTMVERGQGAHHQHRVDRREADLFAGQRLLRHQSGGERPFRGHADRSAPARHPGHADLSGRGGDRVFARPLQRRRRTRQTSLRRLRSPSPPRTSPTSSISPPPGRGMWF